MLTRLCNWWCARNRYVPCHNCKRVIDGGRRHRLTVFRFTCSICAATTHLDFEAYPIVTHVRSLDTPGDGMGSSWEARQARFRLLELETDWR